MRSLTFGLILLGLIQCYAAMSFGAESATDAFFRQFSDHVQDQLDGLVKEHIIKESAKDSNVTIFRDAIMNDLGPALSNGFRPSILSAFEKVETKTKETKNVRQIHLAAKEAFDQLKVEWMDHSASTMAAWAERHPDLAKSLPMTLPSGSPATLSSSNENSVALSKRRFVVGGFGGFWDFMIKTIITWEFLEILFSIFTIAAAGISHRNRGNHPGRHAVVTYYDD